MTGPLLGRRRGARWLPAVLVVGVMAAVWMLRHSWVPMLRDGAMPALVRLSDVSATLQARLRPASTAPTPEIGELVRENRRLNQQLEALKLVADENQELRTLLKLPMPQGYRQVGAQVILRPPLHWYESLQIDQGFEAGLAVNQVVLNDEGVLGKIVEVTARTAQVQLVSHPESAIACLVGTQKIPAMLSGQYRNQPAQLQYLQNYAQVRPGDAVRTSGLGGVFPPNLLLGRVGAVVKQSTRPVPEAQVVLKPLEQAFSHVIVLVPES
ncbi:MAG: rod shape-determining protein MreC [Candidatus Sericytochromatia bacterium]